MLGKLLFKVAKCPLMGKAVGLAFQYFSWAIPVRKVYHSKTILAFRHPKPCYANHLILTPKQAVRNLQHMASGDLGKYFPAIWQAAQDIGISRAEYREGFTLVANGGRKQEVQQVHFHMFSDHRMVDDGVWNQQGGNPVFQDQHLLIAEHLESDWELHFVASPAVPLHPRTGENEMAKGLCELLDGIGCLEDRYAIAAKGYSLVYEYHQQEQQGKSFVFHIIVGKKRTV